MSNYKKPIPLNIATGLEIILNSLLDKPYNEEPSEDEKRYFNLLTKLKENGFDVEKYYDKFNATTLYRIKKEAYVQWNTNWF